MRRTRATARAGHDDVAVRGNVAAPLSLTVADLGKFPVQRVDDTRVVSAQGSESAQSRQFAGLPAARCAERGQADRT